MITLDKDQLARLIMLLHQRANYERCLNGLDAIHVFNSICAVDIKDESITYDEVKQAFAILFSRKLEENYEAIKKLSITLT